MISGIFERRQHFLERLEEKEIAPSCFGRDIYLETHVEDGIEQQLTQRDRSPGRPGFHVSPQEQFERDLMGSPEPMLRHLKVPDYFDHDEGSHFSPFKASPDRRRFFGSTNGSLIRPQRIVEDRPYFPTPSRDSSQTLPTVAQLGTAVRKPSTASYATTDESTEPQQPNLKNKTSEQLPIATESCSESSSVNVPTFDPNQVSVDLKSEQPEELSNKISIQIPEKTLRRDVVRKTLVRSLKRYYAAQFLDRNPDFKKLSLKQKKRRVEGLVKEFLALSFSGQPKFDFRQQQFLKEATALMTMMISPSVFRKIPVFKAHTKLFTRFQDALYKPSLVSLKALNSNKTYKLFLNHFVDQGLFETFVNADSTLSRYSSTYLKEMEVLRHL